MKNESKSQIDEEQLHANIRQARLGAIPVGFMFNDHHHRHRPQLQPAAMAKIMQPDWRPADEVQITRRIPM